MAIRTIQIDESHAATKMRSQYYQSENMKYSSLKSNRLARSLIVRMNRRRRSHNAVDLLGTRIKRGSLFFTIALCILCGGITVGGVYSLLKYETTPGAVGVTPTVWPDNSRISPSKDWPTLIVFAHPRCPCTRATMSELELLIAHCKDRVVAHVVFFTFDGAPENWERTDMWSTAERIPGVTVWSDQEGRLAKEFGAATSGHTVLYDQNSQLAFRGGITASRGHAGDNAGRLAIEAILSEGVSDRSESLVFGCPLHDQCCKRSE